ncbi:MAG: tyrosine-type recombinase/integrase [Polyangiaceae bacterium]
MPRAARDDGAGDPGALEALLRRRQRGHGEDLPHLDRGRAEAGEPPAAGRLHVLRHTFGSRLAIAGAPARAMQEAAGHADLSTTMRYMHLAPAAPRRAPEAAPGGAVV